MSIDVTAQNVLTIAQSAESFDVICPDIYGTLVRANRYFDNRLRNNYWTEASVDDKKRALTEATTIIDTLNFVGEKTDPDQLHQFPRSAIGSLTVDPIVDTTVPSEIEVAGYEIAIQLLSGVDPDREIENLASSVQGFSQARTTYERAYVLEHIAAGVPSAKAWRLLKPYLRDSRRLTISRVN